MMARIRSIHPGFFTDEGVLSCSVTARMLYIGLWVEADCQGVFPWKPVQLKVRLLPMEAFDAAGMSALLEELVAADLIQQFRVGSDVYGAIKGFGKFQRPKNPSRLHPLPEQYRKYVAEGASAPPVEDLEDGVRPQEAGAEVIKLPQRSPSAPPAGGENARMETETEGKGEEGGVGEAPRKRGFRLPEDWTLTADLLAFGISKGLSDRGVRDSAERFVNHWGAATGKNASKLDWDKAFKVWVSNDAADPRYRRAQAQKSPGVW